MEYSSDTSRKITARLDVIGGVLAFLCAVHCFLAPVLLAILPFSLAGGFANESFHDWLIVSAVVLAFASLALGLRTHRYYQLFILPVIASFLFFLAPHGEGALSQALFMGSAGMILVAMHVINKRLCSGCMRCSHGAKHA